MTKMIKDFPLRFEQFSASTSTQSGELGISELPQTVKALLGQDGLLLLMMKQNGIWDLPGGKVDGAEDLETALHREVEEETGLSLSHIDLFAQGLRHRDPRLPVLVHFYETQHPRPWTTGDVRLSHEHRDLVLADAELLSRLPMPEIYRQTGLNWLARAA
jgi:ADP-ribose pyrophosphatase YjhB (NUDIX family)